MVLLARSSQPAAPLRAPGRFVPRRALLSDRELVGLAARWQLWTAWIRRRASTFRPRSRGGVRVRVSLAPVARGIGVLVAVTGAVFLSVFQMLQYLAWDRPLQRHELGRNTERRSCSGDDEHAGRRASSSRLWLLAALGYLRDPPWLAYVTSGVGILGNGHRWTALSVDHRPRVILRSVSALRIS